MFNLTSLQKKLYLSLFLCSFYFFAHTQTISYKINFSNQATPAPEGWEKDYGLPYGVQANGLTYGWKDFASGNPIDITRYGRNRKPSGSTNVFRETLMHMNPEGNYVWEMDIPNGMYEIVVQAGDILPETTADVIHIIRAEGIPVIKFPAALEGFGVKNNVGTVEVTDGKLTLDQEGGLNTKIHFVIIESVDTPVKEPVVLETTPKDGQKEVDPNTSISANFIRLPNLSDGGLTSLDNATISTNTAQLYKITPDGDELVVSTVNGTGGGDAINITPTEALEEFTEYRVVIEGVKDLKGENVLPHVIEFTTGQEIDSTENELDLIAFEKELVAEGNRYTSLVVGPDKKLYGLALNGDIHRWLIHADGTLGEEEVLSSWHDKYGELSAVGLVFHPRATAKRLKVFVSHSSGVLEDAPAWDGKISMLTGDSLEQEVLLVTNLPRSLRDHLTNSLAFRPGENNTLYFVQGSNSAGGEPDGAWGFRPERLLSGACLKLNLKKLARWGITYGLPLDAKTTDNTDAINQAQKKNPFTYDDLYNPYYKRAPLTIYASGIRNAYDLLWHSNGQLYIPTNGTAGGSYSPASIDGMRRPDGTFYRYEKGYQEIPRVGPNNTQRDWLFRVDPQQGVGYYGHPNPLRGEFVMNRASVDVNKYTEDILPDPNYRGIAYDFGFNKSPNGVIEYQNEAAHNGILKGVILVTRYSGGSDIIALVPNGNNGDVKSTKIGVSGLTGFQDPLDLVEDVATGNLYISDFARRQIVLCRPIHDSTYTEVVSKNKREDEVVIYPNPLISKEFSVLLKRNTSEKAVMYLKDKTGAIYYTQTITAGENAVELPESLLLGEGVYLVVIEQANQKPIIKRLMIK